MSKTTMLTPKIRQPRIPAKEGFPPVSILPKLESDERISHWVKTHLSVLEEWNKSGWRWVKIAEALSSHLDKKITRNKLTGMTTMIKKDKLAKRVGYQPACRQN